MMICKADFEELLPHLFTQKAKPRIEPAHSVHDDCIARWKDDGGTAYAVPRQRSERMSKPVPSPALLPNPDYSDIVVAPFLAALSFVPLWATFVNVDAQAGRRFPR